MSEIFFKIFVNAVNIWKSLAGEEENTRFLYAKIEYVYEKY
jgi:hypothetical protein